MIAGFVRRRPLTAFMLWFTAVGQPIAFVPVVARHGYGVELSTEHVLIVATAVGLFAPAVVITRIVDGRAAVRTLLRRMVRVDVPLRWYALALVVVPALVVLTPPRTSAGAGSIATAYLVAYLPALVWQFVTTNWWEEAVWTGFFQARLADRHSAWRAVRITTRFVVFQHVSLMFEGSVLEGVLTFAVLSVVILFARALFGWIYHRTGSLAVAGLVHAAANAAAISFVPRLYGEAGQGAVALLVLGVVALAATRGRLGLDRRSGPAPSGGGRRSAVTTSRVGVSGGQPAGRLPRMTMNYGFVLPGGTAPQQLELAEIAERSGWDGVFVWEGAFGIDAWSLLAAMAVRTSTVRLGTLLTPLPWRRPWKVASQLLTLDELSGGRAILSVGLGAVDAQLGSTGEVIDRRRRADLLDEGLDVIDALFDGTRRYDGSHYTVDLAGADLLAAAARPRPPVWIVGLWGAPKSMRRVLRGDGYLPNVPGGGPGADLLPYVADMRRWLDESAPDGHSIDLVCEGQTPDDDAAAAAAVVEPFAAAGATWWIENRWGGDQHGDDTLAAVRRRLEAGPPKPVRAG